MSRRQRLLDTLEHVQPELRTAAEELIRDLVAAHDRLDEAARIYQAAFSQDAEQVDWSQKPGSVKAKLRDCSARNNQRWLKAQRDFMGWLQVTWDHFFSARSELFPEQDAALRQSWSGYKAAVSQAFEQFVADIDAGDAETFGPDAVLDDQIWNRQIPAVDAAQAKKTVTLTKAAAKYDAARMQATSGDPFFAALIAANED